MRGARCVAAQVLPHLLFRGALCDATHLLIEWHLDALPEQQWSGGVGMRLAFDTLLEKRCATVDAARGTPPVMPLAAGSARWRVVEHSQYASNNRQAMGATAPWINAQLREQSNRLHAQKKMQGLMRKLHKRQKGSA